MQVAIIGCGVAGLTLAISLVDQGHQVRVFEKRAAASVRQEGLFLMLAPNGTSRLANLGPLADLTARGIVTTGIELLHERGKRMGFFDQADHQAVFGGPSLSIARNDLINVLLGWARARGIVVRFDCDLTDLTQSPDQVTARFSDGTALSCDWVAGCDGLGSTVRRQIFPDAPAPHYTGLIGSGGITELPSVAGTGGTMRMVFGHDAFFG